MIVDKAMLTAGVSAVVIAFATFVGTFTSNIYSETANIFEQINEGKKVSVEKVVSDSDIARLKLLTNEVIKEGSTQK